MFLQTELCSEMEFYYFTAPGFCLTTSLGTSTQRDSLKSNIFPGFCFLGHPMMISTKTTWSEVLEVAGKRWRSERDQMEWKMKYNKNQNRYEE